MEAQSQLVVVQRDADASGEAVYLEQLHNAVLYADARHAHDTEAFHRNAARILGNHVVIYDNISQIGIHRRTFHINTPSFPVLYIF